MNSRTIFAASAPVLGGVIAALSLPPFGFWPLGIVGVALLLWRLTGLPLKQRAVAGLTFGWGLYGITIFWVTEFHLVGWAGLVTLQALFFAAAAAFTPSTRPAVVVVAFPAAAVLTEAVHDVWPVGGIPIGGLTLGQAAGPLAPIVRIGGPGLLLAVLIVAGGVLANARAARRLAAIALTFVIVLTTASWLAPAGRESGEVREVALVQGGGRRGFVAVENNPEDVFGAHVAASKTIRSNEEVDLVVWPENAIDVDHIVGTFQDEVLTELARRLDATVVAGVTEDVRTTRFHNVAVAWAPDGAIVARYVKVKRVPFGEYAPYRWLFGNLADLSLLSRDAVAGSGPGILETPAGRLGVAISYEVFFAERGRAAARAGAAVLLVPTNAASFGSTQIPTEEVAAARLRALETGRWVLQAAPTGYTVVVDPQGRVHARSVLSRQEVIRATVPLRTGRTPWVTVGPTPFLAAAAVALALSWGLARRPHPNLTG